MKGGERSHASRDMRVVVFGAGSDLAQALVRHMAAHRPARFELLSRNVAYLERFARDLAIRYGRDARVHPFDATRYDDHPAVVDRLFQDGPVDVAVLAFGVLGDQNRAQEHFPHAREIIEANFLGAVSLLTPLANRMEAQGSGTLVVFSSVAGDRGRRKNYVYGSAKAGLSAFTSGLRGRLAPRGVRVITVKPGVIRTKMTAHLPPSPLMVSPEVVARDVYRAILKGRPSVLYTPRRWRWIMGILNLLPESLFHRLPL